jgi:hypothetical protein
VSLEPSDVASQSNRDSLQLGGLAAKLLHTEKRDDGKNRKGEESDSQHQIEEFHLRNVRLEGG